MLWLSAAVSPVGSRRQLLCRLLLISPARFILAPRRKVKVTPTFIIFRNGEKVHQHGGINETNLHRVRGQLPGAWGALPAGPS